MTVRTRIRRCWAAIKARTGSPSRCTGSGVRRPARRRSICRKRRLRTVRIGRCGGGAVRLFRSNRGTLGVAEGIETALGASLVGNMPVCPVGSCPDLFRRRESIISMSGVMRTGPAWRQPRDWSRVQQEPGYPYTFRTRPRRTGSMPGTKVTMIRLRDPWGLRRRVFCSDELSAVCV